MGWVKNSNYRVVRIFQQRFTHFESGDFRALVPAPTRVPSCHRSQRVARSAPASPRIIPRRLLTESVLAWVVIGVYQFVMPLYRQAACDSGSATTSRRTDYRMHSMCGHCEKALRPPDTDTLLGIDPIWRDDTILQGLKEYGRQLQAESYLGAQMTEPEPPVCLKV